MAKSDILFQTSKKINIKMEEYYIQANKIMKSKPCIEEMIDKIGLDGSFTFTYSKLILLADDKTVRKRAEVNMASELQSKVKIENKIEKSSLFDENSNANSR